MGKLCLTAVFTALFLCVISMRPGTGLAADTSYLLMKIDQKLDKVLENQDKMAKEMKNLKSALGKEDDNNEAKGTQRDTQIPQGQ